MTENMQERCTIDLSSPFWLHYLSLEKSLKEISEYIAINEDNSKSYSFKNMQLYCKHPTIPSFPHLKNAR